MMYHESTYSHSEVFPPVTSRRPGNDVKLPLSCSCVKSISSGSNSGPRYPSIATSSALMSTLRPSPVCVVLLRVKASSFLQFSFISRISTVLFLISALNSLSPPPGLVVVTSRYSAAVSNSGRLGRGVVDAS